MPGGISGKTESKQTVPAFVTKGGEFGVNRGMELAELGYMPYMGPSVAALSPQQYAAMENTQGGLNAFGMATPMSGGMGQGGGQGGSSQAGTSTGGDMMGMYDVAQVGDNPTDQGIEAAYMRNLGRSPDSEGMDFWRENYDPETIDREMARGVQLDPMTGLPAAGNFNGIRGYSSYPVMKGAQQQLQQTYPGQYDAYTGMFIDPQTGKRGAQGDALNNQRNDWQTILYTSGAFSSPRYGGLMGDQTSPFAGRPEYSVGGK